MRENKKQSLISKIPGVFIKPRGCYLRAFCRGSWEQLPDVYRNMFSYAADHGLELRGNAYEEGLNEMAIADMEDYVTQITVLCVPVEGTKKPPQR